MNDSVIRQFPGFPYVGQCLAIRHDDVLLAVPPLHPSTPRKIRVKIFELVLRRLYCEALELAEATADELDGRTSEVARIRSLMGRGKHSWELEAAA